MLTGDFSIRDACVFKKIRHGQEDPLKFKLSVRMGKKEDLCSFECGMVVVSDRLI